MARVLQGTRCGKEDALEWYTGLDDESDKWIVCGDWELVYDYTPTFLSAG